VHVLNDGAILATKEYIFRLDCNCDTRCQQNTSSGSPDQTFYRPYRHMTILICALDLNVELRKCILGLRQHTIAHNFHSIFRHDYELSSIPVSPICCILSDYDNEANYINVRALDVCVSVIPSSSQSLIKYVNQQCAVQLALSQQIRYSNNQSVW
jgi:hypothetical protein